MKSWFFIFFLLFPFFSSYAEPQTAEVKQTISRYAKAADSQDIQQMSLVLHENFRVAASMGAKLFIMNKTDYVAKLKAGKIGGENRKLKIDRISFAGPYAFADIALSSGKRTFYDRLVLYQVKGHWQILQNTATIH